MDNSFLFALGASLAAAAVTLAGIVAVRYFEQQSRAKSIYFVAFAAGVLIAVSLLHLAPESFEMAHQGPLCLLGGYLALYLFNRFVCAVVCDRQPEGHGAQHCGIGWVPLVGIAIHSFIDGIVYSVTFSVSLFTGTLAAVGMVLHEFPEGIITYLLLVRSGFRTRTAFWLALVAAALSTPLGTLASYLFVRQLDRPVLGALLAVSGGALLYVGATHLLPQAESENRRYTLLALAAGVAVALTIVAVE